MNKLMLPALGCCLALSLVSNAQTTPSDTISITPLPGTKVLLIGNTMKRLLKENNFEVVKNQFIHDMKESAKDQDFPAEPKEALYLVAANGRRRLKAKPEELTFDTEKEIKAFEADLPTVHYTIHDLRNQFEYHIYLKDAQQLDQLEAINFSLAINALVIKEKKAHKHTRIELEADGKDWRVTPTPRNKTDLLELYASAGIASFNSIISPSLGVHVDFIFLNKHRLPRYKIGASATFYALGEYENFQFKNVYGATSLDLRLMSNIFPQSDKPVWMGFLFGRIRTGQPDSQVKPSLSDRLKFGIVTETNKLAVEFSFIPAARDQPSLQSLAFHFKF